MQELRLKFIALLASSVFVCGGLGVVQAQQPKASFHEFARRGSSNHSRASRSATKKAARRRQTVTIIRARAGDALATLAERFDVPVEDLARVNGVGVNSSLRVGQRITIPTKPTSESAQTADETSERQTIGKRIRFADGTTFDADDVWKDGEDVWYRSGSVSHRIERQVRSIESIVVPTPARATAAPPVANLAEVKTLEKNTSAKTEAVASSILIYLVGGARVKVDEVNETDGGAWYRRGNLSVFLDREQIVRVEREPLVSTKAGWANRGWTSGSVGIDGLIRANGARLGIDPYLIFLVIEQESHFQARVVSPKGARGLMQLMPGTARRFGVSRPFDPSENIRAGTQYLKELMELFGGRVDLALAGYNAGEGAVVRFGGAVPPFRETQDYVKRISKRYVLSKPSDVKREGAGKLPRVQ
jgi:LysM repeat protein